LKSGGIQDIAIVPVIQEEQEGETISGSNFGIFETKKW